jgi:hypothetical protein
MRKVGQQKPNEKNKTPQQQQQQKQQQQQQQQQQQRKEQHEFILQVPDFDVEVLGGRHHEVFQVALRLAGAEHDDSCHTCVMCGPRLRRRIKGKQTRRDIAVLYDVRTK